MKKQLMPPGTGTCSLVNNKKAANGYKAAPKSKAIRAGSSGVHWL